MKDHPNCPFCSGSGIGLFMVEAQGQRWMPRPITTDCPSPLLQAGPCLALERVDYAEGSVARTLSAGNLVWLIDMVEGCKDGDGDRYNTMVGEVLDWLRPMLPATMAKS